MIRNSVARFILLLASRGAVLMQTNGRDIEHIVMLTYGDAFFDTLKTALKRQPYYPLKIIVDAPQMDVQMADIPPVSPWTRQAIIERQGKHFFPKAVLQASQRFFDTSSNTWKVQHVGCGSETWLKTVFEKVRSGANPVEPLSFFPIEWADYAGQVSVLPKTGWQCINVLGESFGLRQMVMKDGRVQFTRSHTDCYPSLPRDELTTRIAAHMQTTLDYMPRLDAAAPHVMPVRLYVPDFLMDMSSSAAMVAMNVQLVALSPPKQNSVPPEWGADIAWLSVAGSQKNAVMPIDPEWRREIRDGSMKKNIALWVLLLFGSAGVYSGMSMLMQVSDAAPLSTSVPMVAPVIEDTKPVTQIEPPIELQVVGPIAPPLPTPPTLKLQAVLYHAPHDWSVWINGEKHVPGEVKDHLTLLHVSSNAVRVLWQDGAAEKQFSLNLIASANR
jgi:hypothetical protein